MANSPNYSNNFGKGKNRGAKVPAAHRLRAGQRWLISRESTINQPITFWVNPNECQWRVGTRTTIEKISGGAVHHEWPQVGNIGQPSDTRLDQPQITFSFQSGIIVPGYYQSKRGDDPQVGPLSSDIPPGLGNFYDFLSLLDQPNLTAAGNPNYVNILYSSSTFPQIWLQGFFTEDGVSWTDNAGDPYQVNAWGATFVAFKTQPSLRNGLRERFNSLWGG